MGSFVVPLVDHYVPKFFFSLPLIEAKIGDKQFWEEKLHATNGKLYMHSRRPIVFP